MFKNLPGYSQNLMIKLKMMEALKLGVLKYYFAKRPSIGHCFTSLSQALNHFLIMSNVSDNQTNNKHRPVPKVTIMQYQPYIPFNYL